MMDAHQHETKKPPRRADTPPFECGDVSRIGRVPVVHSLSVSEPRSLDKPMGRDVVLGIMEFCSCRLSFKDLESGEYDIAR